MAAQAAMGEMAGTEGMDATEGATSFALTLSVRGMADAEATAVLADRGGQVDPEGRGARFSIRETSRHS